MKQKDYHKPGYWKDWYWNKGGREKVNLSKKVNQVLNQIEKEKKSWLRSSHCEGVKYDKTLEAYTGLKWQVIKSLMTVHTIISRN